MQPNRRAAPGGAGAPPPAPLSRSTLALLRRVVHAWREGWVREELLARAVRAAVEDARRERAPAAQLAAALRRAWADMPDLGALEPQAARDLLTQLVTACVLAYYGARYDERRDGAAA